MASYEAGRRRRFLLHPWEIMWRGRPRPRNPLHRRNSQGIPEGRGGRKLNIIIDAGGAVEPSWRRLALPLPFSRQASRILMGAFSEPAFHACR